MMTMERKNDGDDENEAASKTKKDLATSKQARK